MRYLKASGLSQSGEWVTGAHFGGNAIGRRNTENGTPSADFMKAVEALDIPILRYPAGEPDIAYLDGLMQGDALPDHLQNFLDIARAHGQKVVIVTPTHAAYSGSSELNTFVQMLMHDYGDLVHAFEIGNEYWNHQTETSYGQVANESVIAIDDALTATGDDVPIWVQMGDAGGQASEFHITNNASGWLWRNIEANNRIIEQLSTETRTVIDGVVEHYYLRTEDQVLGHFVENDQYIPMDLDIWEGTLGTDLTLNITEWNIRTSNLDQLGIRAASTLITQFSYLMQMDVDEAYVWPPQHNTSTDLAGGNEVIRDERTGIVINSVGGAAFDLMSSNLVGLERMHASLKNSGYEILPSVYANDERAVVYLSSRSNEVEHITYDFGDIFPLATVSSATLVGYDPSSSDGQHYNYSQRQFVESDYVIVEGERYYINEHDVRAQLTELDTSSFTSDGAVTAMLKPYEVLQITFDLSQVRVLSGDSSADRLNGTTGDDSIRAFEGNDTVRAGSGQDIILGGAGDDFVDAGRHADQVSGGDGDDVLRGWGGADTLDGGRGDDDLSGSFGNDLLIGGRGNDQLSGGSGADTLSDGEGADILAGDAGDDQINLESSNTFAAGYAAWNVSSSFQVGTGVLVPIEGLREYQAVIDGGDGLDELLLSAENDAIFLHNDVSAFHADAVSLPRLMGVERILGQAGNDVIDMTSPTHSLAGIMMELDGGTGDDVIWGSNADEMIFGGQGDDTLFGGAGENTLTGGDGADVFELTASSLDTQIADFSVADGDVIRIYDSLNLMSWTRSGTLIELEFDAGRMDFQLRAEEASLFSDAHLRQGDLTHL